MTREPFCASAPWLPLGEACRLVKASDSALRQWADNGWVTAFRTPGGHRRFSRDDLVTLVESGGRPARDYGAVSWDEAALRRIRRRLRSGRNAPPLWLDRVDEAGRGRLRLFGHRLLDLASQYAARRRGRGRLLEEARLIGEEYGEESARLEVPLREAVQAFLFFRNALTDALQQADGAGRRDGDSLWRQVNGVTDAVLLGLAAAYDRKEAGWTS